jgi:hypothetical protein
MKEVFLPLVVLDEPKSLVNSQRTNRSGHCALLEPAARELAAWRINSSTNLRAQRLSSEGPPFFGSLGK